MFYNLEELLFHTIHSRAQVLAHERAASICARQSAACSWLHRLLHGAGTCKPEECKKASFAVCQKMKVKFVEGWAYEPVKSTALTKWVRVGRWLPGCSAASCRVCCWDVPSSSCAAEVLPLR